MKSKALLGPIVVLLVVLSFAVSIPLPLARGASPVPQAPTVTLYSVASGDGLLRTIDQTNGATLSSVQMTLSGSNVGNATALATRPIDGTLWAIVGGGGAVAGQATGRPLVRVNPTTGVATLVGNTGDNFAGLAFDCSNNLYGITGDGAAEPESLFSINTTTGAATLLSRLRRGDDGEAIAFNPNDSMIYHSSGHTGAYDPSNNDGVMFEKLNPLQPPFTNIPVGVPLTDNEVQALTWNATGSAFFWAQNLTSASGTLFRVTSAGAPTLIGTMNHKAKGLALSGSTLYSVSSRDNLLRVINQATGATTSSVAITLASEQLVLSAQGLAAQPSNGQLFVILTISGVANRSLATVNSTTGVATVIGNTGDYVNSLAFDAAGNLYGTTGPAEGNLYDALVRISTSTAGLTYVYTLDRETAGLTLAFNSTDSLFYFGAGASPGSMYFEKFNVANLPTNIDISDTSLTDEEAQALALIPGTTNFLWKQNHGTGPLFRVTSTGSDTLLGNMDHQAKGLAFVGGTSCQPPSITLSAEPSSMVVPAGLAATYRITVGAAGGLSGNVTFTCSNLPPKSECVISPSSVTVDGLNPATVTVVINTQVGINSVPPALPSAPFGSPGGALFWSLALALLAATVYLMVRGSKRTRATSALAFACLLALLWTGCSSANGTNQGQYQVRVTASSGSVQQTIDLGLTIR